MRTSTAGCADIIRREGSRRRAYLDTKGIPTIGAGHTGRAGPPAVHLGMVISGAEILAIMAADLAPMERAVSSAIHVPITQGQFDAVMSLVFNIGTRNFLRSTVLRRINALQWAAAADAFLLWNKPPELTSRRRAERLQFLRGTALLPSVRSAPAQPILPLPPPKIALAATRVIATPRPAPLPPSPTPRPETTPMKNKVPFLAALLLALFGVSAANAGEVDFAPLVSAGIEYLIVPVLSSLAIWVVAQVGVLMTRLANRYPAYLDQKTAATLASNVNGVLDKAIAFGASQASGLIGRSDLKSNVDGWVASYAAEYAVKHAPDLMKQAGDISQKIVARLAEHPAVLELKASIGDALPAPLQLHPAA